MDAPDLAAIERLLSDFAWSADRGLGKELAKLFLPDAVLTVNGQKLRGRSEIADDCRHRFEKRLGKTRHIWSNPRLDMLDDGTCAGTAVQLTFESMGSETSTKLRVNDVADRFERDGQGAWRFRSRTIERQMAVVLPTDA